MTKRRLIKPLGYAIGSLVIGAAVNAQSFDINVELSAYTTSNTHIATDLVPDPSGLGYRSDITGANAVLKAKYSNGNLSLRGQFRLEMDADEATATVDEAYAEYMVGGGQGFVFAGRRILSYGQSYGLNAAEIFADPLRENRVYPSIKARNDVEGVDMIGGEWLFNSGASLTALYAPEFDQRGDDTPEDFSMLRYTAVGAGGALDYALTAFSGNRPGVGVSASYGIGDASVVYLDGTVRRGRDKATITGLAGDQLLVAAPNADQIVSYVTLGFGYTFTNGMTMNAEYTHDSGGYSDNEWASIDSALNALTPVQSALAGQSLGQLNGTLNHYTLRQNYGFLRIAEEGVFGSKFNAEFTVLHGFDDGSGTGALRVERAIGEVFTVGAMLSQRYGDANTEFNLRPAKSSISFYTTMRF